MTAADLLSALERSGVDEARLAQVARLIELASVGDGARVGSIVQVEDRAGRISEYELVERPDDAARHRVTPDSAVGQALFGARRDDRLRITFGNGRCCRVRVLDVSRS
jgi:transcription elongation GreA/GreB family factor